MAEGASGLERQTTAVVLQVSLQPFRPRVDRQLCWWCAGCVDVISSVKKRSVILISSGVKYNTRVVCWWHVLPRTMPETRASRRRRLDERRHAWMCPTTTRVIISGLTGLSKTEGGNSSSGSSSGRNGHGGPRTNHVREAPSSLSRASQGSQQEQEKNEVVDDDGRLNKVGATTLSRARGRPALRFPEATDSLSHRVLFLMPPPLLLAAGGAWLSVRVRVRL